MALRELTVEDYDSVVGSAGIVLVDFWAAWCGPCKMMLPVLEKLAEENVDVLSVVKVNADDQPDLVSRFNVFSIPTILVYVNGEVVKTIVGAKPLPGLLQDIDPFLNDARNSL